MTIIEVCVGKGSIPDPLLVQLKCGIDKLDCDGPAVFSEPVAAENIAEICWETRYRGSYLAVIEVLVVTDEREIA